MSTTRKTKPKAKPIAVWRSPGATEALDEAELVAQSILDDRSDLLPSVAKVMNSGLELSGRLIALELFRDSLVDPSSEFRDPRAAIERAREEQVVTGTETV